MSNFGIYAIFLITISPAIGSFLAVLVDRLPRDENVVSAQSACRSCGTKLRPTNLIPIVSFIAQSGRCQTCTNPIPAWLLYIEILTLGATILAVIAANGVLSSAILNSIFLWLLIAAAIADLRWFRLPDILTLCLAVIAFALAFSPMGIGLNAISGAVLGVGSFAGLRYIYKRLRGVDGLGLGDVKLMVGLGAFTGPSDLPLLVLIAAILALIIAASQHLLGRKSINGKTPLPFGTFLCSAAALLWIVYQTH